MQSLSVADTDITHWTKAYKISVNLLNIKSVHELDHVFKSPVKILCFHLELG